MIDTPLPTLVYETRGDFLADPTAAYIFGQTAEDRTHFPTAWKDQQTCSFVELEEDVDGLNVRPTGQTDWVPLRSENRLIDFLSAQQCGHVYIDLTGLPHHIWAPLVRVAVDEGYELDVVYVEPRDYRFSDVPRAGDVFDLSDSIRGISPLPGFTRLARTFDAAARFVPLLGFEGARLRYVQEQVQPEGGATIPVIGVPGFRPEYPFYTYEGNEPALVSTGCWKDVRLASANCPFDLFVTLEEISLQWPDQILKVAPIGTKPHALGAVLFALAYADRTELIYDHPVRKSGRTEGEFRTLVYRVSRFMQERATS